MTQIRNDASKDIEIEILSRPKYVKYAINYKEKIRKIC